MKVIIALAFVVILASCAWQDGYYYGGLWGGYRDWEDYDMIVLNPTDIANQYGNLKIYIQRPFIYFDKIMNDNEDLDKLARGRRWNIDMEGFFFPTTSLNPDF